jgi:CoA:oxalate CoA-transferase
MVKEDHFWRNLCKVINKEELSNMPMQEREDKTDELEAMLKDIFLTKTRDEWVDILTKADVPCGPLYDSMEEVFNDPQLRHRNMILDDGKSKEINSPLKFEGFTRRAGGPVPAMGEHTEEILSQLLEIKENEIKELKESQVI